MIDWIEILAESSEIISLIFILMVAVEIIELKYSGWLRRYFLEDKTIKKYFFTSIIGAIPGCSGMFLTDTMYMAGFAGFGSIVAAMIASAGDEAFIIIGYTLSGNSNFDLQTIGIFFVFLIVMGVFGGAVADFVVKKFSISVAKKCHIDKHDHIDVPNIDWGHFFKEHIWSHIVKKHLFRIIIWILFSLLVLHTLEHFFRLEDVLSHSQVLLILFAGLSGLAPTAGPHILFITFFAEGVIPFSVLITNSIIQEGHGLVPLLGFSLEDSVKIKLFKFVFGLTIGYSLMFLGY